MQWPWSYSGTQEAIDQKTDIDGLISRSERELKAFRRHVDQKLATKGQRRGALRVRGVAIRWPVDSLTLVRSHHPQTIPFP